MDFIQALLLGLVQGLTEFLPVSSSGHIEMGKEILGITINEGDGKLFTIVVHGATALSTIVVFRTDLRHISRDLLTFRWTDSTNLVLFIILSMIPAVAVGLLLEEHIDKLFEGNMLLVGSMLFVTAILLFTTTLIKPKRGFLNFWKAFVIGVAQAIAILPGISRSGSTIATGMLLGVNRNRMARFSFLMVLPLIFGVMAKDLMDYNPNADSDVGVMPLIVGFIAAFISGLFACRWMIKLVRKSKLSYFAIYCAIIGAIAIVYSFI